MKRLTQAEAPSLTQPTSQPLEVENQEPESASEKYMSSLWSEIIGVDEISLSDTFLGIGGNSLTLNVIMHRIQAERNVSLEPQLFFDPDGSSLSELAKELDRLLDKP